MLIVACPVDVKTPAAILGVRGTEFVVRASDGSP